MRLTEYTTGNGYKPPVSSRLHTSQRLLEQIIASLLDLGQPAFALDARFMITKSSLAALATLYINITAGFLM